MRQNQCRELANFQVNQMGTQEWRTEVPIKNPVARHVDQPQEDE